MNFACVRAGLIVAALIFPCVSTAEEDRVWPRGTYTVQIENDRIANTDRHYTNGIRFAWISDRHENGPDWSKGLLEMLYPFADLRAGRVGETAAGSREVRGKTLGIVGYGNIGSQIAVLAESMGLRVIYHDHTDKLRHVNAEPAASIDDLLTRSDIVTLHVPETPATDRMIGAAEIARMKDGAFLINNSRGTVVDLDALAAALQSRKLGGAAIDVFPVEPSSNADRFTSPLQGAPNVILTPHVGGSTEEAQERIGEEVTRKLIEYSDVGSTVGAVNFPQVQLSPRPDRIRFIQVQRNKPSELGKLNEVFALHDVNIAAQHYHTDGEIGYVVLDTDGVRTDAEDILRDIRGLSGTIRARVLNQPS